MDISYIRKTLSPSSPFQLTSALSEKRAKTCSAWPPHLRQSRLWVVETWGVEITENNPLCILLFSLLHQDLGLYGLKHGCILY